MSAAPVPAILALADGTVFRGEAIGAAGASAGEVVFNTAMTGYQEILTDPSYRGQIVLMTAPEIGNVGVNPEDFEAVHPFCAGFVVRNLSPRVSSWRAEADLGRSDRRAGVRFLAADLSSLANVRRAAAAIRKEIPGTVEPVVCGTAHAAASVHEGDVRLNGLTKVMPAGGMRLATSAAFAAYAPEFWMP